jgi:transcriptional regulator with XRE-family HTH domain
MQSQTIPERLRSLRASRDWTRADLSHESRVSFSTIAALETGRHDPRLTTLEKLAHAFGFTLPEFVTNLELRCHQYEGPVSVRRFREVT